MDLHYKVDESGVVMRFEPLNLTFNYRVCGAASLRGKSHFNISREITFVLRIIRQSRSRISG